MKNALRLPSLFFWILAAVLTTTIGLYFRLYPFYKNVSSDAYEKSTMIVLSRIRASVTEQINRKFPDMPSAQKEEAIKNMVNKVIREDNARIRQAFDDLGSKILENSKDSKHYLLESDSYYFLDLTENILDKGDVSPQIQGSKYFNERMLAPIGYWEPQTWHPYIGAWVYKIVHLFAPREDVAFGVAFTPLFLLPFVVAAFLFSCRFMGCAWFPSLIASIFFVLATIYLKRSTYAWYDSDTYNVLFPVASVGLLFAALRHITEQKKAFLFSVLSAATIALYAKFWYGWGFLWALVMAGLAGILIKKFVLKESRIKETLHAALVIFIASVVGVLIMYGPQEIARIVSFSWGELQKFTMPAFKGWPDLFIIVGELKHGTWEDIVQFTGGPIMFAGAVLALVTALLRLIVKKTVTNEVVILGLFFAVTLLLSMGAQRFTILLLTPTSLLFALCLNTLWEARLSVRNKIPPAITTGLVAGLFLIGTVVPIVTSQKTIRSLLNPIFNSAWDRALTQIREKTPENSVIDNWWAPGHFIKAVAKRKVIFDGASIRGDIAYWLTRVYLSQNEDEALGILRMMNTSSNQAAEYLQKEGLPLSKAVEILTAALSMNASQAQTFYAQVLSPRVAEQLILLTHSAPPPSYMLIYNENVDGNVLLAYLGKWDFKKIEDLNRNPAALKKVPSKSSKNYIDFLWNLVGGPFRQGTPLAPIAQNGTELLFPDGITIDTASMTVRVASRQYGHGIPKSIFFEDNGVIREKQQENASLGYSVIFYQNPNEPPRCVLMDHVLANSLLMKMYYFQGKGLTHFKPFAQETDLTGRTKIYIYEILWPESFKK